MRVLAFDPLLETRDPVFAASGVACASLQELVASSDVVTLHVPLLEGTRGLFDGERIAAMKPGAVLVNTSRGHIVDMHALVLALQSGHLGGAAVDVFDTEPLPATETLQDCPNLLLTPHISGVSLEANERVSSLIAGKVLEALE
jgi:(S)-sulfolactate dehydrogenase